MKIYNNGILINTINTTNCVALENSDPLRIGHFYSQGNGVFNGYIDNVRIYNRSLGIDEAVEIYNRTKNKYQ
jgi:hypothetical protein